MLRARCWVPSKIICDLVTASETQSFLKFSGAGDAVQLAAHGDWTAPNAAVLDKVIDAALADVGSARQVAVDLSGLSAIDTFGAWHLTTLDRRMRLNGVHVQQSGLAPHYQELMRLVEETGIDRPPAPEKRMPGLATLEAIGHNTVEARGSLKLLANMLGAICVALLRTIAKPSSFRLTSTVHHVDRVGLKAVPIILLITFLIGCIIAQQGFFHFRKFGADDYVVDMVGILVLREIGVLIVAIMVAGRSGSSYTAELGSMKMREEIDALRTMGFDPVQILVLPRVIALMISLPILTFLGSMSALYGGELVAWLYGGMSPDIFVARLKDAISITHFKVGMIKAPFMALVIGVVACSEGFRVGGSAESLGLRTTSSVVTAIFLVIVLDGLFAIFFASIGM